MPHRVPLVATFSSFVVFVGLLLLLEHNAVHGRAIATVRPPREHVTKVHEHAPRPVRRFHPCRLVHVRRPAGSGGARVESALLNLQGRAGRLLREKGLVISLKVDWLSFFPRTTKRVSVGTSCPKYSRGSRSPCARRSPSCCPMRGAKHRSAAGSRQWPARAWLPRMRRGVLPARRGQWPVFAPKSKVAQSRSSPWRHPSGSAVASGHWFGPCIGEWPL